MISDSFTFEGLFCLGQVLNCSVQWYVDVAGKSKLENLEGYITFEINT